VKALDTNVLVRYLVSDDTPMASRVQRLFDAAEEDGESFVISLLVLLETIWVLRSTYKVSKEGILTAVRLLLALPVVQVEEPLLVRDLITLSQTADIDLADCLIGLRARSLGAEATLTFDKKATRDALFEEVPPCTDERP